MIIFLELFKSSNLIEQATIVKCFSLSSGSVPNLFAFCTCFKFELPLSSIQIIYRLRYIINSRRTISPIRIHLYQSPKNNIKSIPISKTIYYKFLTIKIFFNLLESFIIEKAFFDVYKINFIKAPKK